LQNERRRKTLSVQSGTNCLLFFINERKIERDWPLIKVYDVCICIKEKE
jgi:hypothetical protein